jgi:hypothetical protein
MALGHMVALHTVPYCQPMESEHLRQHSDGLLVTDRDVDQTSPCPRSKSAGRSAAGCRTIPLSPISRTSIPSLLSDHTGQGDPRRIHRPVELRFRWVQSALLEIAAAVTLRRELRGEWLLGRGNSGRIPSNAANARDWYDLTAPRSH